MADDLEGERGEVGLSTSFPVEVRMTRRHLRFGKMKRSEEVMDGRLGGADRLEVAVVDDLRVVGVE